LATEHLRHKGPADRVIYSGFANTLDEAETAFAANVRRFLELAEWREIEPPDPFDDAPGG